jgi:epsilon-lactone hydrolase
MASPELDWCKQRIASDRARAGVSAEFHDVRAARAALPATDLPMPDGTRVTYEVVGEAACHWVMAPRADPLRRIVYLHGGGYLLGGFHSHRSLAGWLSDRAAAAILFVEYRLAPEYRFPAAVNDTFAAYLHALDAGPGVPSAPRSVFVAGDSAGGGLAMACVQKARESGVRLPDGGVILCGMLDLDEETSRFLQLTQRSRDGVRLYVDRLKDLKDPLASPMYADLARFPPLLIQTGTDDYCADENERFARKAEAAGVDTVFESWPEMIHVWQRFAPKLPEANQALDRIGEWIRATEARSAANVAAIG